MCKVSDRVEQTKQREFYAYICVYDDSQVVVDQYDLAVDEPTAILFFDKKSAQIHANDCMSESECNLKISVKKVKIQK